MLTCVLFEQVCEGDNAAHANGSGSIRAAMQCLKFSMHSLILFINFDLFVSDTKRPCLFLTSTWFAGFSFGLCHEPIYSITCRFNVAFHISSKKTLLDLIASEMVVR